MADGPASEGAAVRHAALPPGVASEEPQWCDTPADAVLSPLGALLSKDGASLWHGFLGLLIPALQHQGLRPPLLAQWAEVGTGTYGAGGSGRLCNAPPRTPVWSLSLGGSLG